MISSKLKFELKSIISPLLICCYLLILFSPAFYSQEPLLQTDQPLWTIVAYLLRSDIFPDQGWFWNVVFDQGGAGQIMGRTYSVPLILPWLFTFFCSAATAVKLATILSTLIFLLSFYYVAKLFVSEGYSLLCTAVMLTPVFDTIVAGMWYNLFSLGCGLSFWLCCHHFFKDRSWIAFTFGVLSFALAFYAHPIGVVLCVTVLLTYLVLVVTTDGSHKLIIFSCFLYMFCLVILLAFPQIQAILGLDAGPYLSSSEQATHNPLEITGALETFSRLFLLKIWGGITEPGMSFLFTLMNMMAVWVLVFFGLCSLMADKDPKKILPFCLLFVITVILISRVYNYLNIDMGMLRSLSTHYGRFQLFSQFYLILIAGVGLQFFARYKSKKTLFKLIYYFLILNLIFIAIRTPKKIYWDHTSQLGTLEASVLSADVQNLWQWLADNVDTDNERVYFEDTYRKFLWNNSSYSEASKTHLLALTRMHTDVRQIGGWCGFSSAFAGKYEQGTFFGKSIHDADFSDQFVLSRMTNLNCRYIVSCSDIVVDRLNLVPFLEEVSTFGVFHVFKNSEMLPAWAFHTATGEKVDYIRHSSSHFEVIAEGKKGDQIFVSMAYHPNYLATYNEDNIPIINTELFMSVKLPGDGRQSINFHYVFRKKIALYALGLGLFLMVLTAIGMYRFLPGRRHSLKYS